MKSENLHPMRLSTTAAVLVLVLGVTCSLLAGPDAAGSGNAPLRIVADVSMPGPAVRFDYQSLDQDQGRLYISHMNADQLVVFDTTTHQVVDRHPEAENVWIVGGGSGHGFKHGPVMGEMVADAVLGLKAPPTEMGLGRLLKIGSS